MLKKSLQLFHPVLYHSLPKTVFNCTTQSFYHTISQHRIMKIGTHDGVFHCDEVLACFMLKQLPQFKDAEIVRTRDTEKLKTCDIVVDVGAEFNHEAKRYDHHQRKFTETLSSLRPELGDKYKIKFTCRSYDDQTEHINVNEVRKDLFASKNKLVISLPPTSAALYKHALRAAYQAGPIWPNALKTEVSIPCSSSWGWTKEKESWTPEWSAVTAIWSQLSLLYHCACKYGCETMRCGCRRVSLPCTAQCKSCKGGCTNQKSVNVIFNALYLSCLFCFVRCAIKSICIYSMQGYFALITGLTQNYK